MIPKEVTYETETNMQDVESVEMTIDESKAGKQFLMNLLTKLYEDPTTATIREYSTNAIDAQIEQGFDGYVDVTLPTWESPEFVVRDYGIGMSYEDIRDTYSMYVNSTKRTSNAVAGMYGIGSKSALAYTDSFSVESVVDGMKVIGLIQRVGTGRSKIELVRHERTSERQGTTVRIPVHNVPNFVRSAKQFYSLLKPGKFKVDGIDLAQPKDQYERISDNLVIKRNMSHYDMSYIVMGNVPYPVRHNEGPFAKVNGRFVYYIDVGRLNPTPPRESLEQDEVYAKEIPNIINEIEIEVANSVTKKIDSFDGNEFAVWLLQNEELVNKWNLSKHIKFKGKSLGDGVKHKGWVVSSTVSEAKRDTEVLFKPYATGIHVINYPHDDVSDGIRRKFNNWKYSFRKSISVGMRVTDLQRVDVAGGTRNVYVHKGSTVTHAHAKGMVVDYKDVKEYETTKSTYSYGSNVVKAGEDWKVVKQDKLQPSYDTWKATKYTTEVAKYDKYDSSKQTLFYFSPTDIHRGTAPVVHAAINDPKYFVVVKNANQHEKTVRDHPEAITIKDYKKILRDEVVSKHGGWAFVNFEDHRNLVDLKGPLFDKYREQRDKYTSKQSRELRSQFYWIKPNGLTEQDEHDTLVEQIKKEYPLVTQIYGLTAEVIQRDYIDMIDGLKE